MNVMDPTDFGLSERGSGDMWHASNSIYWFYLITVILSESRHMRNCGYDMTDARNLKELSARFQSRVHVETVDCKKSFHDYRRNALIFPLISILRVECQFNDDSWTEELTTAFVTDDKVREGLRLGKFSLFLGSDTKKIYLRCIVKIAE